MAEILEELFKKYNFRPVDGMLYNRIKINTMTIHIKFNGILNISNKKYTYFNNIMDEAINEINPLGNFDRIVIRDSNCSGITIRVFRSSLQVSGNLILNAHSIPNIMKDLYNFDIINEFSSVSCPLMIGSIDNYLMKEDCKMFFVKYFPKTNKLIITFSKDQMFNLENVYQEIIRCHDYDDV